MSVSFNGQDIKGSPFDLRVRGVSAEKSYLEVRDLGPLPGAGKFDLNIVAVDQDGTPLKLRGDHFTTSFSVDDKSQVNSSHFFFLLSVGVDEPFLFFSSFSADRLPPPSPTFKMGHTPLIYSHGEWQVRPVSQIRGKRDQGQPFNFGRLQSQPLRPNTDPLRRQGSRILQCHLPPKM